MHRTEYETARVVGSRRFYEGTSTQGHSISIAPSRLHDHHRQTCRRNPRAVLHARLLRHRTLWNFPVNQAISRGLFADSSVESLELAGNVIDKTDLMRMEGVDAFLARREKNKNKNLQGGGMLTLSVCGLD